MTRLVPFDEGAVSENAVADFKETTMYGKCGIGREFVFFSKWLKTYYIPIEDIANIYREVEMVDASCCTAGENLHIHRMIISLKDGREVISQAAGRREGEKLDALIVERGISNKILGRDRHGKAAYSH
ncbi:MAG: hypothetical protein KBS83_01125 [Lachnospiraceae bacterium]|nr:hypothetical protein [Candidatus Equihabitans merdae]